MTRKFSSTRSLLAAGVCGSLACLGLTTAASAAPRPDVVPLSACINPDNGDPVVTALSADRSGVDVRQGAEIVTFTASLKDTGGPGKPSGVRRAQISVFSPLHPVLQSTGVRFTHVSGPTWVAKLKIPRWSTAGTWHVSQLSIDDRAGNTQTYDQGDLDTLGFPITIDVQSHADATAPSLTAFTFSPTTVDTTKGPASIAITAKATDEQAGIRSFEVLAGSVGSGGVHSSSTSLHRHGGQWIGELPIKQWQGTNPWRISLVYITDRRDNSAEVRPADLDALGFKHRFNVISRDDVLPPRMKTFESTPDLLDLRADDGQITYTIHATDKGSGVDAIWVDLINQTTPTFVRLKLQSGTPSDGIWSGALKLSHCAALAPKLKALVSLSDAAANYNTRKPAVATTVMSNDNTVPTITAINVSAGVSEDIHVTFSEDIVGVRNDSFIAQPLNDPDNPVGGTVSCLDANDDPANCKTGPVRSVTFDPASDLEPSTAYFLVINPEHVLSIRDAAGNAPRRAERYFFTHA